MNILKYIKENILKYKPIFKIKIKKTWFSCEYYNIMFSKNNGWTYDYIYKARTDYDGPYETYYAEPDCFKFTEIKNILKYNYKTLEECISHNESVFKYIERRNNENEEHYLTERKEFSDFKKTLKCGSKL
jgi:hypothetical protein